MKKLIYALPLLLFAACGNDESAMEEMSTDELQEHIYEDGFDDEVLYLDVREEDEFAEKHISGFTNIPMNDVMEDPAIVGEDQEVIILCQTQNRSIEVGEHLIENGYDADHLTVVMGGIADYEGDTVAEE
ncbi:rhodanese-like domain-containing protein [Alkalicoccus luteus]|uniref:Rhodanese-like domain-containing protein n=1 Tax=Alkalicoccus luteus TaxID=1237094 RepID=A0A969PQN0_9BACI|nr:rhodanese-like domain-containing protein [Alkalicoccus luteus]NJP38630.1 rhodanese-like domain-containing protein [Alkalicoccus luteus]